MEEAALRSKRPAWSRTVAVQVALCVAMYAAFSLGEPRFHRSLGRGEEASLGRGGRGGVSFLSVAGGARPAAEQARLLRQEPIHDGKISASSREQIKWLEQSIAGTSSNWKIVVGYDSLVCAEAHTLETTKFYDPLQRIFAKYAVNAYISTGGPCGYFRRDNSMLYIGNPSPGDHTSLDGFLLHIVSPLEMESVLINLEGKVVERSVVHRHGLEAL